MANNTLVPVVVERDPKGFERSYDIYSRLLKDFVVFVTGEIEMGMANTFIAQLLYLESVNPDREVKVYVNSPGGGVHAGNAMIDTMRHIKNPVSTINVGLCASMGAMLLATGASKGKRYALPESYTMIHQPLNMSVGGKASDVEVSANMLLRIRDNIAKRLAEVTGKDFDQVKQDMILDNWMSAEEAKEYGLVDEIIKPNANK